MAWVAYIKTKGACWLAGAQEQQWHCWIEERLPSGAVPAFDVVVTENVSWGEASSAGSQFWVKRGYIFNFLWLLLDTDTESWKKPLWFLDKMIY